MSFSSSLLMLLWIIRVEFISDWLEPWFIFVVMLFSKESIKTMISAKRQITLTKIIIERFLYFLILSPWLSSNFAMILSQLASSCNLRYWNPEISTDNALYTLSLIHILYILACHLFLLYVVLNTTLFIIAYLCQKEKYFIR